MDKFITIILIHILSLNFIQAQSYRIEIEIPDLPNQLVRIGHHSGPDVFVVDSAMTNATGQAVLSGNKALEKGVYFMVMPSSAHFDFLVTEKQNLKIYTHQYHTLDSLKIAGDIQNVAFVDFQKKIGEYNRLSRQLGIEKQFYARNKDSIASIDKRLQLIESERGELFDSLANMFSGSVFGDIIQAMIPVETPVTVQMWRTDNPRRYFDYLSHHFFDNINFAEPAVFNAPVHVFHNQLEQYCKYFLNARVDSLHLVKSEVDYLLNKASASETASRYVISYLMDNYEQPSMVGMDALFVYLSKEYFENGKIPWASDAMVQEISRRAGLLEMNLVGNTAVNLKFPDRNGEMHSLHDGHGRYTVLWFYETDCNLCKQETPKLKGVYDDLQAMNIDLITINIDQNKERWESFIDDKQLTFLNLWNAENNPTLQYAYGTHKTPRLYILNAEKKIVAKDVSVSKLLDYIAYLDEKTLNQKNEFLFNSPVQKPE